MIRAWKKLKVNSGVFLLYELMFRTLLIFLFTTGCSNLIEFLLNFHGYSYVTQGNYVKFLMHPSSAIGLLLFCLLILFLILYECSGLLLLFDAGDKGVRLSLSRLLFLSWNYSMNMLRKYPVKWIFYLLLCLPNLYLHLLAWEMERARFIHIVVKDICKKTGIPNFTGLMVVYFLVSVVFSTGLPFRIFGGEEEFLPGPIAFSVRKGKQLKNLFQTMFLQARVFVVTELWYLLSVVICVFCIRRFRPVYRYVSDTLFYGSILKLFLGFLIGFFGTVTILGHLYLVFREHREACICWEEAEPLQRERTITVVALLLTAALMLQEGSLFFPDTSDSQDYLEITAHRGGAKFAPENTMAAIRYSIDTKADFAEIDVQETKDGEIVLMHDNWLGRTTGKRKYIWDLEYKDLQELEAGRHFSRGFEGEPIPTLREVIRECKGKLRLNIEIKANGHNDDIVSRVLQIIREEGFTSHCVITSMDYQFLREIKELCPEVITGYTLSMVYGRVEDMEAADFYSVKHTFVNRRLVNRVHEMGKKICAWTVNKRPPIRKVIDAGVDNVITDDPELVRKELMGEYDVIPGFISLIKYMIQ
ncbi:MAG: glycerophosphodiester phosphodiesterase family protein [Lachnospiraceae bacterium]|nr:glycerophosphodiester phosphodiesterase family protein [Lachnospiraceae bacterium]